MILDDKNRVLSTSNELEIFHLNGVKHFLISEVNSPVVIKSENFEVSYNGKDWQDEFFADLSYPDLIYFDVYLRPAESLNGKLIIEV